MSAIKVDMATVKIVEIITKRVKEGTFADFCCCFKIINEKNLFLILNKAVVEGRKSAI